MEIEKDPIIWKKAKRIAGFKRHLMTYLAINAFAWIIWMMTHSNSFAEHQGLPWPAWMSLGWGLGIGMDYYSAYHGNKEDMAEKEYRKLTDKK